MDVIQVLRSDDRPARFYIDGRRVSRERYESTMNAAPAAGTLCNLSTRAVQLPGGHFKRWNYSTISDSRQR